MVGEWVGEKGDWRRTQGIEKEEMDKRQMEKPAKGSRQ